ncbi:hypothetical protein CIG75_04435 [Tumebacillus algifaecis]|uniref:ABC3 transporter permease protein domain-containing protein n=1 Tax=Tumebacillus algifaecis TaxID=1214604 RepID=A0A223CZ02_9BACL|nr:ABC transporter permease [Tumebacillus algifaecis]ASS74307.1 hypothetical protein CIG75_04435 [Tumebacillus algifaecis]
MIFTLLLSLLLLWVLWKTYRTAGNAPHLRRMAWRNLVQHKQTTVLTVLGAMIGTALITSALLFQHSIERSGDDLLEQQFGRIGYDVPATGQLKLGADFFDEQVVDLLRRSIEQDQVQDVERLLPTIGLVTELRKTDTFGRTVLLQPGIYVQGFDQQLAREFDARAMQDVPDIGANEIVLSQPVAKRLEVAAGDVVMLQGAAYRVRAVVAERGLTGYRGIGQAQGTALVAMETARKLSEVPEGQYTNLLLSHKQYLFSSGRIGNSSAVLFMTDRDLHGVEVRGLAEQGLDHSMKLLPIFTIASWNAIAIGMMLIVNIFKMIAEERRQELGVLRALGMTRTDLAGLLRLEGTYYALLSGTIGALVGIGISYGMLLTTGDLFASALTQLEGLQIEYHFKLGFSPLMKGFALGVLLIEFCSWRVAKQVSDMSIIDALDATVDKAGGRIGHDRRTLLHTSLYLVAAVVTVGLFFLTLTDSFRTGLPEQAPGMFPLLLFVLGLFWTMVGAVLLTRSFGTVSVVVQQLLAPFGRTVALLRLALRYPILQRTRTMLVVLMFALVFFLTALSGVFNETLSAQFAAYDVRPILGGYDLMASVEGKRLSSVELRTALDRSCELDDNSVEAVASVWQVALSGASDPVPIDQNDPKINGIDLSFAEQTTLSLSERDPQYRSDREAWLAVASNPNVMIVSQRDVRGHQVGDLAYQRSSTDGWIHKRIIGIAAYDVKSYTFSSLSGVFVKQSEIEQYASDRKLIASELLLRLQEEQATAETLSSVEKALALQGIYPLRIPKQEFALNAAYPQMLLNLFESFSLLAALIGSGGLTIIMMRVIRERRQQIGMLRAIGVRPSLIYWSILVEGFLIGMLGITLGTVIGSYVGSIMSELFANGDAVTILFPYGKLSLYVGGTLLIVLLGTMLPARQVFRMPPAEATKYVGS